MACSCNQSSETVMMKVENIIQHDEGTYSFDLSHQADLTWKEGDSFKLYLDIDGFLKGKKFSVANLPDASGLVRFTTRIRSPKSKYKEVLSLVGPGTSLVGETPSGDFVLKRDGRPAILLSNGVGIATMRSLIHSFNEDYSGVNKVVQINVDRSSEIFKDELDALAHDNMRFDSFYTKNRREFYEVLDYESQKLMFQTGVIPNVYVVGSDEFVMDVAGYLSDMGYLPNHILTDGFNIHSGGCSSCSTSSCGSCSC